MARDQIKFGVELDRQTDGDFREIAIAEKRSKRQMHAVLVRRVCNLWKKNPSQLEEIGLVKRAF